MKNYWLLYISLYLCRKFCYMRKFFISFIGLVMLWSCDKKDDPEPTPEPTVYDRTVLVYMSGENDLTKGSDNFMATDLKEMDEGSYQLNDNQHLIVFIDSIGKNNPPHIVEIANGQRKLLYQYDSDFPASDPGKFSEVVKWTIEHYPSKDYGLVLWGHASGWIVENDSVANRLNTRAYGYDYGYDTEDGRKSMNITQMAKALNDIPKLKYIFADCCSFMCVENAYELKDAADYLIGSPAEIPGEGAPYQTIIPALFSNSGTFYKDICDIYYDYYLDAYKTSEYILFGLEGYSVPLSVIDLSKMELLAQATNSLLATIAPAITQPAELDLSNLPFYFSSNSSTGFKIMYDMATVFHQYTSNSDYSQWLSVFNQTVPYSLASRKWQTMYTPILNSFDFFPIDEGLYGNVSMFFPQQSYDKSTYKFNSRIKNFQWYYRMNWSNYGW